MLRYSGRRGVPLVAVCVATLLGVGATGVAAAAPRSADTHQSVSHDQRAHAVSPAVSPAPCTNPSTIASCVTAILAPAAGTHGVFLQKVGGPVVASDNDGFAYEPASSIKPLIALYAMTQVEGGHASLTDQVPMIDGSGGPDDCPPSDFTGTESLGNAIQQMLQVSDNNRTDELMQHFGVANLNTFASSLGLSHSKFHTSSSAPGFNVIGCLSYGYNPLPSTVDGNTMTLDDAASLWSKIAALPAPLADAVYGLAAGRDMANTEGYDFTGVWPSVESIADEVAPSTLTSAQLTSYIDRMTVSVKGGSYGVVDCPSSCSEATWWVFAGNADIPSCSAGQVVETPYNWGYFINDAVEAGSDPNNSVASTAFFNASGQLLAAPIASGLSSWAACAPKALPKVHAKGKAVSSGLDVPVTATLANVNDTDKTDIAGDLTASIQWGDGTTSFGTVSGGDGKFTVHGWHAYAGAKTYKAKVTVTNEQSDKSVRTKLRIKVT
jgi:Beta-lactamase enzyme family